MVVVDFLEYIANISIHDMFQGKRKVKSMNEIDTIAVNHYWLNVKLYQKNESHNYKHTIAILAEKYT